MKCIVNKRGIERSHIDMLRAQLKRGNKSSENGGELFGIELSGENQSKHFPCLLAIFFIIELRNLLNYLNIYPLSFQ